MLPSSEVLAVAHLKHLEIQEWTYMDIHKKKSTKINTLTKLVKRRLIVTCSEPW